LATKIHSQKYIRRIRELEPEDIKRVASKYLLKENLTIVSLLPKEKNAKAILNKKQLGSFNIGVENLSQETNLPIQKHTLDNASTVLIKEKHDFPLVSIKAIFKGGLRAEKENSNGLSNLLAQMLNKGTKSKTSVEIAKLIESKGARISSFSGNNSFGLSLDILSKDFDQMLELFSDLLINSSFPKKEIKKQKDKNLAQLKAQEDNIFDLGRKELKATLFTKHPYGLLEIGNKDSLAKINRRDLRAFRDKLCVGKNMVLAIFGDVNSKEALKKVQMLFNSLDAGKSYDITTEKEPQIKGMRQSFRESSKEQTLLMLGFHGTDVLSQDRYPLELICQVLSNPSGRLFSQIREKAGLAYTLGAYPVLGLDPGYITLYAATTKDNAEIVKKYILDELKLLKSGSLTDQELTHAKRALIGQKLISRQTNSACAMESSLDELYGLGFNYYQNYTELIEAVQLKDIQRCITQYFDINNYASVIVGPN